METVRKVYQELEIKSSQSNNFTGILSSDLLICFFVLFNKYFLLSTIISNDINIISTEYIYNQYGTPPLHFYGDSPYFFLKYYMII